MMETLYPVNFHLILNLQMAQQFLLLPAGLIYRLNKEIKMLMTNTLYMALI